MSEKLNLFRSNIWVPLYPVELLSAPDRLDKVLTHLPSRRTQRGDYTIPFGHFFEGDEPVRMFGLLTYSALGGEGLYYLKLHESESTRLSLPSSINEGTPKDVTINGFTVDLGESVLPMSVKAVSPDGTNVPLNIEEALGLRSHLKGKIRQAMERNAIYMATTET